MAGSLNFVAAWVGVLLGMVSGAAIGLWFYEPQWLGGYASWPRRIVRLGHISFFGLAAVNFLFFYTRGLSDSPDGVWAAPSALLLIGAATMPTVCFLSAWRHGFRRLFFVPVGTLIVGVAWTLAVLVIYGLVIYTPNGVR